MKLKFKFFGHKILRVRTTKFGIDIYVHTRTHYKANFSVILSLKPDNISQSTLNFGLFSMLNNFYEMLGYLSPAGVRW